MIYRVQRTDFNMFCTRCCVSLLSCVSRKAGVAKGIHLVRKVTYQSLYISRSGN